MKTSNFVKNFSFIFKESSLKNQTALSIELGIDQSQISKLLNGRKPPSRNELISISDFVGVDAKDLFLTPKTFQETYNKGQLRSDLVLNSLRVVQKSMPNYRNIFKKYRGQYILYNNPGRGSTIVASLLTIKKITKEGIFVELINPYKGAGQDYQVWKYSGLMVPAGNYLYLFLEQKAELNDLLTVILKMSSAPKVTAMAGLFAGIGVLNDEDFISATYIYCLKVTKPIKDFRSELGNKLGYLKLSQTPRPVQLRFQEKKYIIV